MLVHHWKNTFRGHVLFAFQLSSQQFKMRAIAEIQTTHDHGFQDLMPGSSRLCLDRTLFKILLALNPSALFCTCDWYTFVS